MNRVRRGDTISFEDGTNARVIQISDEGFKCESHFPNKYPLTRKHYNMKYATIFRPYIESSSISPQPIITA
jgi:hypothetical protein